MKTQKNRHRGGASCPCPKCSKPTHVVVTRREETGAIRRVRECIARACGAKFQTLETVVVVTHAGRT